MLITPASGADDGHLLALNISCLNCTSNLRANQCILCSTALEFSCTQLSANWPIIIIIIIIIWHYNPLWVFAFSAMFLQVLSLAVSFQFFTFSYFRSAITSSCHRCLGLPTGLVPMGLQSNSFLVGLAWSIHWICPNHLILCALMNLTISAPSINLSISMLFHILHILSILTGPNIFLSIKLTHIPPKMDPVW